MAVKGKNNKTSSFEEQVEEIKEWQENLYNPGHYIGTGKVPLPLKKLISSPIMTIVLGMIFFILPLIEIIQYFSIEMIISNIIPLVVGIILIIGGLIRIKKIS